MSKEEKMKDQETKEQQPETVKSRQVSLCICSSCISPKNCKSLQQATNTAYQIAKAACTFNVNEVIVLQKLDDESDDDNEEVELNHKKRSRKELNLNGEELVQQRKIDSEMMLLAGLLQFFVTPPYLVESVFANSPIDVRKFSYAKKLPTISMLPFMQANGGRGNKKYREGMTIQNMSKSRKKTASGKVKKIKKTDRMTKFVNVGLKTLLELKQAVPKGARVTVDMKKHTVVSPYGAYGSSGMNNSYGYQVRAATNIQTLLGQSGLPEGYDMILYSCCGEYFTTNRSTEWSKAIHPLDREEVAKLSGNILLVIIPGNDWSAIFNESKLDGKAQDLFDGSIDIPSKARVEDGCMISLSKLYD